MTTPATDRPEDPAVLRAQGLSFGYPGRPLFDGWSADFTAGLTWLRGPNGSGKSTLLRLLGGALDPLLGRLAVDGIAAADDPFSYRRAVFWCSPDAIAFDHLRPDEYLGFLAGLYPTQQAQRLADLLPALGLAPFMGKRISQLSTGTQRKLAVAAALCAGTRVVLLDEPLAALDAKTLAVVRAELARGAADRSQALIVTSHEPLGEAAEALARSIELPAPA